MKKALLAAALLVIAAGGAAVWFLRSRSQPRVVPFAPADAGSPESSLLFVARTEPPSIWRVFAAGKLERLDITVDTETSEGPEGSTLPRVSPDARRVAVIKQSNL